MKQFEEVFGVRILEGYGLSETSPVACFNHIDRPSKAGTVGQPLWGVDVMCVDENDQPVPVGDHIYLVTGQLLPPQSNLHCVEAKTGKVLWSKEKVGEYHAALVRTGDNKLVMLDDYGHLSLLDPSPEGFKEMAKTKIGIRTWVTPAIASGKIVVRDDRELMCFPAE
jgi:long-chain acyl-CoA synthetase